MRRWILAACVALGACSKQQDEARKDPGDPQPKSSANDHVRHYADVALASSKATAPVPLEGVRIFVGRKALSLSDGGPPLLIVPADATHGFSAKDKAGGTRADLALTALRDAKLEGSSERAVLYVDRETPYRIVVEVLFTLGQRNFGTYALVVQSSDGSGKEASIELIAPRAGGGAPMAMPTTMLPTPLAPPGFKTPLPLARPFMGKIVSDPIAPPVVACGAVPLDFDVRVVADGFGVRGFGGSLARDCTRGGLGRTIPLHAAAYDYDALAACAHAAKTCSPRYASERRVQLGMTPDLDFQHLVSTADAVRDDFPELVLTLST